MDALKSISNRTTTWNDASAYSETASSLLNAFCNVWNSSGRELSELLSSAWMEDPNLTLRLIWHLRSIHDGTSDKDAFYRAFGWLFQKHLRTAITNLRMLVEPVCKRPGLGRGGSHGYWKDLLNILSLATIDALEPSLREQSKHLTRKGRSRSRPPINHHISSQINHERIVQQLADTRYRALYIAIARLFVAGLSRDVCKMAAIDALPAGTNRGKLIQELSLASKWAPTPSLSHDRVTNISTAISALLYHLKPASYSFPSMLTAVEGPLIESREAALVLRSFYRRWVLTPLRRLIDVPERLMSANQWADIVYSRVPSLCMHSNSEHFFQHDPDRFQQYLIDVEKRKSNISGATLLPHQLVMEVSQQHNTIQETHLSQKKARYPALLEVRKCIAETRLRVAEAQWKALVTSLRVSGSLDSTIAVCDVSGSMGCIQQGDADDNPIAPAVSLSILTATLAKSPFDGGFITFSADPRFVRLDLSQPLGYTIKKIVDADWGMNTDLNAVFTRLLLPLAVRHRLRPEDMIRRVVVFSDMQFDECAASSVPSNGAYKPTVAKRDPSILRDAWCANYDAVVSAYREHGYEVPQIVFWNLSRHVSTFEAQESRKGVVMLSGFSASMLKAFMGEEVPGKDDISDDSAVTSRESEYELTPVDFMKKVLSQPSFDGLVIVD
ncbi:hypothetical protein FISHEDRAFT_41995 [Fistulina hepatica ATCC 64428]|uniref:Uncharacterized protein n=1 Tax=Fistulina hepatica ATCC 64428 TaxID=1128425 RepID=A0A0D7AGX4_9AGAR|nr:hypothetical protein FISHEDRAFT_41995 [Fistulina hepatica ATCC 64428]